MSDTLHTVRGYQMMAHSGMTDALEDYLEMVVRLSARQGYTRVGDVARELGVAASSASKMLRKLGELGYLLYERYGMVRPSAQGRELGGYLLRRHQAVSRFFALLAPDSDHVREAELVEHCISPGTVERLEALVRVLEDNPGLMRPSLD